MEKKKIILLGAGDLAREIMYTALECREGPDYWQPTAFVDVDPVKIGTSVEGIKVVSLEEAKRMVHENVYFISAIGTPDKREGAIKDLLKVIPDARFATVIHRSAVIMQNTRIDEGVYMGAHATVGIGCHLGRHVVLNFNVSIGHDCDIGDYSVINPACVLSGRTRVLQGVYFGSGVITYPGVEIGKDSIIGAGVVVARKVAGAKKLVLEPHTMILPNEK